MVAKVLAVGDLHIQDSSVIVIGLLKQKLVDLIKKEKPDIIVLMGDTLHDHREMYSDLFNIADDFVATLATLLPVYLLIGNHDYINNQQFITTQHPFNTYKRWDPKLYDVTIVDHVVTSEINDHTMSFVPFVPPGRFMEALKTSTHPYKDNTVIFSHQQFEGCQMDKVSPDEGDTWSEDDPLIVSGHDHTAQTVGTNIIYTGTSYQTNFGDDLNKTVSMFTFSGDGYKHKRIDLGLPKKYDIRITLPDYEDKKILEQIKSGKVGDTFKVSVLGTSEQFATFRKSMLHTKLDSMNVRMVYKLPKTNQTRMLLPKSIQEEMKKESDIPTTATKSVGDTLTSKIHFQKIVEAYVIEADNKYLKRAYDTVFGDKSN